MHARVFLGGDRYHLPLVPLFAALAAAGLSRGRQIRMFGAQVETPAPTIR